MKLYTSPLFRKAADFCQRRYGRWFVLSAKFGPVAPDTVIQPYDLTLNTVGTSARLSWGQKVYRQLVEAGLADEDFAMHAGRNYCDPLRGLVKMTEPLKGLGIGEQLAWYGKQD